MTIRSSYSSIGLNYFQRIEMFWQVLFDGQSISLYRNRPIWADTAGGDFALSQKGLTKKIQYFRNNLVQFMKKNSEWSKLIELFSVVNVSSDMVCEYSLQVYYPFSTPPWKIWGTNLFPKKYWFCLSCPKIILGPKSWRENLFKGHFSLMKISKRHPEFTCLFNYVY